MVPGTRIERAALAVPPGASVTAGGVVTVPADEKANSVTVPEKRFLLAKSISVELVPPGVAVSSVLTDDTVKSGPVTTTVAVAVCCRLQPEDPLTLTK